MDPFSAIGSVATLADTIFKWVTEADGYHEWSTSKKLEKLHAAAIQALTAKDFTALDLLLREYRRLSDQIV